MIFLIVEGTLLWALLKYRGRRSAPEAAQIRGNTPLELGWTVGAALILVPMRGPDRPVHGHLEQAVAPEPVRGP